MEIKFNMAAKDERLLVLDMLYKAYQSDLIEYLDDRGEVIATKSQVKKLADISVDDEPVLTDDEKEALTKVAVEAVTEDKPEPPSHKLKTTETEKDLGPDVDGIPFDQRIHARTKVKNKDGTWRKKRGVDPELVKTVEAELRQAVEAPVLTPPEPPVADPLTSLVPPPPPVNGDAVNFSTLLQKVSECKMNGTLSDDDFNDLWQSLGLPNFASLQHRADLIPSVWDKVKNL